MTMPHERTRAVLHTREFLEEILGNHAVPDEVRRQVRALLRHYPSKSDMQLAHLACPAWFGSPRDVS